LHSKAIPSNKSTQRKLHCTMTETTATTTKKTPSESDVYDRQIRLWGAEAQKKMQNSKVLYIHVTGGSSEVLKNLCLAGIKAAICDPRSCPELEPCFFSHTGERKKIRYESVAHAVRPLVEELNPLLGSCPIVEKQISELTTDDLKDYAVVVASRLPQTEAVRISKLLAENSVLYTIDCFGMRGCAMIDFGSGDTNYRPEVGKKLLDPIPLKEKIPLEKMLSVPLHKAINRFHKKGPPPTWIMYRAMLDYHRQTNTWLGSESVDSEQAKLVIEKFLKDQQVALPQDDMNSLISAGMAQVVPVCAVLGGMVGNEVIKIISGKGEPANNTLLLDGNLCKSWTFLVKEKV